MRPDSLLITNPLQALRAGVSLTDTAAILEHAQEAASSDPAGGLPLVRTAVRAAHLTGVRCLRVRAFRTLGSTFCALGPAFHRKSEGALAVAFGASDGCNCCLPGLWRSLSYLQWEQGKQEEALQSINDSLRLYEGLNRRAGLGKGYLFRGIIFGYSGRIDEAISDHNKALDLIPPSDKVFYHAAQHALVDSLRRSRDPNRLEEAASRLPAVRESLRRVRGAESQRAKHRWMEGGLYARQAEVKPGLDSFQRHGLRCKSAHHLRIAVKKHRKLPALTLELNACAADLAAVEYHLDRAKLDELLRTTTPAPELAGLWAAVLSAVREPEPVFWAALEALRSATVERGCTPPLVPYGLATGW